MVSVQQPCEHRQVRSHGIGLLSTISDYRAATTAAPSTCGCSNAANCVNVELTWHITLGISNHHSTALAKSYIYQLRSSDLQARSYLYGSTTTTRFTKEFRKWPSTKTTGPRNANTVMPTYCQVALPAILARLQLTYHVYRTSMCWRGSVLFYLQLNAFNQLVAMLFDRHVLHTALSSL